MTSICPLCGSEETSREIWCDTIITEIVHYRCLSQTTNGSIYKKCYQPRAYNYYWPIAAKTPEQYFSMANLIIAAIHKVDNF